MLESHSSRSRRSFSSARTWSQRRSGGYQQLPQKKVLRDTGYQTQTVTQYDGREPQTWFERKFEQFQAWMTACKNRTKRSVTFAEGTKLGNKSSFVERYQVYLFGAFFVMVWVVIYFSHQARYNDLQALIQEIEQELRTEINPVLAEMTSPVTPATATDAGSNPLSSRLSQSQSQSRAPTSRRQRGVSSQAPAAPSAKLPPSKSELQRRKRRQTKRCKVPSASRRAAMDRKGRQMAPTGDHKAAESLLRKTKTQ